MSRLIDADALFDAFEKTDWWNNADRDEVAEKLLLTQPTIDAVSVVRCKECKWLRYCETEDLDLYLDCDKPDGGGIPRNEDWFCADGERKDKCKECWYWSEVHKRCENKCGCQFKPYGKSKESE